MAENAWHQAQREHILKLQDLVSRYNAEVVDLNQRLKAAQTDLATVKNDLAAAKAAPIEADVDIAEINAELEQIDTTNSHVRTNQEKAKAKDEAEQAEAEYAAAGRAVEDVRQRRMALLNSVQMPLPGLSIEAGELVYNGAKWDCMSSMERVVVAISIVRQLQPKCGFVLLDQLEVFDRAQLAKLRDWLAENNMQAIATRVADDDTCDIIIEDGQVLEDLRKPAPKTAPDDELEQF